MRGLGGAVQCELVFVQRHVANSGSYSRMFVQAAAGTKRSCAKTSYSRHVYIKHRQYRTGNVILFSTSCCCLLSIRREDPLKSTSSRRNCGGFGGAGATSPRPQLHSCYIVRRRLVEGRLSMRSQDPSPSRRAIFMPPPKS